MGLIPLLPDMDNCCFCVPDIRVAAAVIAVLGIVTSPSVAWATVKHAYSLKISLIITTDSPSVEIVDLSLQHILSFGFGSNAGVGTSCFGNVGKIKTTKPDGDDKVFLRAIQHTSSPAFIAAVKYFGWLVLLVDVAFVAVSVHLLFSVFKTQCRKIALMFIVVAIVNVLLSFVYALLYIAACIKVGTHFPVFELIFALMDLGMWFYFICIINTFAQHEGAPSQPRPST